MGLAGRRTDGRTSSCTSLASSSSDSKEKETGDDGDGERKKKEEEKQKEREGLDGGGMIRKFFSTPIEAVRSFVPSLLGTQTRSRWRRRRKEDNGMEALSRTL